MSRKAKYPISIPSGVEVTIAGNDVKVKGSKGSLELSIKEGINVANEEGSVKVSMKNENPDLKKFLGLYHSLITNMVTGVTQGFQKVLTMIGVGYRAAVKGDVVDLTVGLSHPAELKIPEGISVTVEKNTRITVSGADAQLVGEFAAKIRRVRPPEPYQGKGIRYENEYVRKKAGKSAAK